MVLKGVYVRYGENVVLDGFSYAFPEGVTCVMGRSGCGKSTLLGIILKTVIPESGTVIAPDDVSAVWQEDRLLEWLTVYDNIMLARRSKPEEYAIELCRQMGIYSELNKRPPELSGGQRSRAAIVRALVADYSLIVMDEPFKALDAATKRTVMETTKKALAGKRALIVTHDAEEAGFFTSNILTMDGPPLRIV